MPLICTYLRRPTATPLSPPPIRLSSACVTLISCLKSQKAGFFFSSFPPFFFPADRDVTELVLWRGGGGAQRHWRAALRCPLAPRLAAAALILLSPSSKQRRNEKAVCKLISSTTHYQTHAQNNPQLRLWLLPTWRN